MEMLIKILIEETKRALENEENRNLIVCQSVKVVLDSQKNKTLTDEEYNKALEILKKYESGENNNG